MNNTEARTLDEYIMSWTTNEPLIGLNYVIEYQRAGRESMYECILCDFIGYLHIFVSHLSGFKHRVNYMTKEYPEMMKLDGSKLKEEELFQIVKERAGIIEKLEGKRNIQVIRGHDPPSSIGTVQRVPLLSNSWQQEMERNPSRMEQDLIEGTVNPRDQLMGSKMIFSTAKEDGQYETNVSTSMYPDWRRDEKDLYGENTGATERFAENRMQLREVLSSGHTDWSRDIKGPYEGYDQCSNQQMDDRGAMIADRIQESSGYADWRRPPQQETENFIKSSERYSNIRNDEQPLYPGDGRGMDYRRDDRQYEDKCRGREQIGKSDCWMERKSNLSRQKFSDVGDFKRKKMYDYLQNFQIKSEDDASFVLKVTKTFKDALIRYYQKKEAVFTIGSRILWEQT
ncbi:uncharacterized protein [Narcine bancroftii]|uniref:uncharacterized protein isoform X2 n=1 Tax=Narcine bancroftii TaxID=1343680 RepID=UPI0038321B58